MSKGYEDYYAEITALFFHACETYDIDPENPNDVMQNADLIWAVLEGSNALHPEMTFQGFKMAIGIEGAKAQFQKQFKPRRKVVDV